MVLVAVSAGALPRDQVADGGAVGRRRGRRVLVGLDFLARCFFADGTDAQANFLFFLIHLDDLEVVLVAGLEMHRLSVAIDGFGVVAEAFDALSDFDECAEVGHAQNLAVDDVADAMLREERIPNIGLHLLDAEREAALVGLNGEDDGFDLVALLQDFGRMLDARGPAQVADVDEAVDSVFDFDEGAELGEIADAAFDGRAHGILVVQRIPRVGGQLPHAERDAAFGRIDADHDAIDLVAHVDELRGMLHALRPGHFADVDEAFDALLEFDEGAVIGNADDAAVDVRAHGIAVLRRRATDRA